MTRLNVNPTRMELKKLRARLSTAVRGHKLLKDKSDEMIRRFSIILREDYALRREVEAALSDGLRRFSVARSVTPAYEAETAFALPTVGIAADCGVESVMGVDLNDEATSLMVYQKAYTAACRLMTVLEEALDSLINGTVV